jgi:hypothetical protein
MTFLIIIFSPVAYAGYTDECKPENTWTQKSEAGNFSKDREITGTVCVDAGVYNYLNVNIYSKDGKTQAKLIFLDANIDFWAKSILVENGGGLIAGSPEDPIGKKDIRNTVTIHLYGKDTDDGITCKTTTPEKSTAPDFVCGVPATPDNDIWNNKCDPKGCPLPGGVEDKFYGYKKFETDQDKEVRSYFGRKVLAVSYGGTLRMFGNKGATYFYKVDPSKAAIVKAPVKKGDVRLILGKFVDWKIGDKITLVPNNNLSGPSSIYTIQQITAESGDLHASITIESPGITFDSDGKTDYMVVLMDPSGTSWARLDKSLKEGDKTATLDREVDWQVGDKIVVTTTDYLPGHSEELEIIKIKDKKEITFKEGIQYTHNGEKYSLTKHSIPDRLTKEGFNIKEVETRAAVALLSRNIRIVSGGDDYNKELPDDSYFGGHTIVRQGFKQFQIQGVELKQLGQGGRPVRRLTSS